MKTASWWHPAEGGGAQCDLCPHGCIVPEGKTGLCKVRGTVDANLKALSYGLISSAGVDPIEKKPLYHFYPGSDIFSLGSWGCNLACAFCQNWTLSQQTASEGDRYPPEQVVRNALQVGSIGVAYTYNEPLVGFEFVRDCAALVRKAGLVNVLVTNGYVRAEPAAELIPLMDAMNIDIKSMDDAFYRDHCHAKLQPVLDFARQAVRGGVHVEITNLVIPGLNDDTKMIHALARWMRENLGESIPLHLSAYHPQYKLKTRATPVETLEQAHETAGKELLYVYIGNVLTSRGQSTACPKCGQVLIERVGYSTTIRGLKNRACSKCGRLFEAIVAKESDR